MVRNASGWNAVGSNMSHRRVFETRTGQGNLFYVRWKLATIAQLAEQSPRKRPVIGSIPIRGSQGIRRRKRIVV